jgi:hypothetical protein
VRVIAQQCHNTKLLKIDNESEKRIKTNLKERLFQLERGKLACQSDHLKKTLNSEAVQGAIPLPTG